MASSWRVAAAAGLLTLVWSSFYAAFARGQEEGDDVPIQAALEDDPGAGAGPPAGSPESDRDRWLIEQLDRAVSARRSLAGARVGVAVQDLVTGRVLYRRDADTTYNVASNTKLVTAAAALALLGPDFRYRTQIFAEEIDDAGVVTGHLHVRTRGDPTIGTSDMAALVEELVGAGVTAVRGGLVIDDSYFDGDIEPPHFDEQPGELASFRAPVSAASLNFNAVAVVVTPARSGDGAATVVTDPPTDYVRLSGQVQTVRTGRTRVRVDIRYERDSMEIVVGGQIHAGAGPHRYRYRVGHPVAYFGGTLRALLERRGVRVGDRRIRSGEVPERALRLTSRSSPPMSVIVRGLGKYSNNFVAEALLKTMGAEALLGEARPATWADGIAAVRGYLIDYVGFAPEGFRYSNGSGLFDSSELSPDHIVRLLAAAYRDFRYSPDLVASLAIAGTDGTLRQRMAGGVAERQVRAKTGTLATVSALGGYVAVDSRHPLAFAVLVNDMPRGSAREARALQDEVAKAMVLYARSAE